VIEFRDLVDADDLAALPPFEQRIWGGDSELVSVNVLVATISEGGMAIGAFDHQVLVGAVYGFATREPEVLHSHYLAVEPAYRRRGLAKELKLRQRHWCLERGITAMRWTYDPLQVGNANFNIEVLGAEGIAYHRNHYGVLGGINGGLPSDRVTVRWDLLGHRRTGHEVLEVDVPPCTADDIATSSPAAEAARYGLREALEPALADGWRITAVHHDERRYLLTR
jgi:chorismate synthase